MLRRLHRIAPLLLLLVSVGVAPRVSAAEDIGAGFAARLEQALGARALRGARTGAMVVDAQGRTLFAHHPDRALAPASNAKILTAVAALARFGPAHRFETLLLADRQPDAAGSIGLLVVRGGGDPALNSEDWWQVADALRRAGVARIRGDIVVDDSLFDAVRWHPSWQRVSARAYHAPVGALTANYGAFAVTVGPGAAPGRPARVTLAPPVSQLRLALRARTAPAGGRPALRVDRNGAGPGGREEVVVSGRVPLDAPPRTFYRSVLDPALYAGSVLRMQLDAVGIAVDGRVRRGAIPAHTVELLRHEGRPLAQIVRLCMKYSNNQIAESLVKSLALRAGAARGSWQPGVAELRRILAGLGVDPEGFALRDGSGLSYESRVTPRALVQALRAAEQSFDFGPELLASLPLANLDGTLAERAAEAIGAVRAKTGTLDSITALSGFARLANGERAAFSILVNGYRGGDREAMDAVDAFAAELVLAPPPLARERVRHAAAGSLR